MRLRALPNTDAHYLTFLAEPCGNDRGTFVDFRGCCHRLPWKFTGFHDNYQCSRYLHGKCHGRGHGTCRSYVRGKLGRTNHGNPWQTPSYQSRKPTVVRGNCHSACRSSVSGQIRQYQPCPRKSAIIATAVPAIATAVPVGTAVARKSTVIDMSFPIVYPNDGVGGHVGWYFAWVRVRASVRVRGRVRSMVLKNMIM